MNKPERHLTHRFLTLPFRHQIGIAQTLNLMIDEDKTLSNSTLINLWFARATKEQKLEKLWDETELRHNEKIPGPNPFAGR